MKSSRIAGWVIALGVLSGLVHCNGVLGDTCGGTSSSAVGRPQPGVCAPSGTASGYPGGGPACTTLADCPAHSRFNGCLQGRCTVDQCLGDGDCAGGLACGCANQFGGNAIHSNACIASGCRVDGDCGPGEVCSASIGTFCGSLDGYYCHSASDECHTDADCCSDRPACRYQPTLGHWACGAKSTCNG